MYISESKLTILIYLALAGLLIAGLVLWFSPSKNTQDFQTENAAQDLSSFSEYHKAEVVEVVAEQVDELPNNVSIYQSLNIKLDDTQEVVPAEFTKIMDSTGSSSYKVGDKVVVGVIEPVDSFSDKDYIIVDRYRISGVVVAVIGFIALSLLFARKKGLWSLLGLGLAALVLIFFTAPLIISGKSPVLVSLISASVIAITTMYIAHGFNIRTKLSILSTLISLGVAMLVSWFFVQSSQLFGLGQADAFILQSGYFGTIDLRGLLLAGLIISLLGILDDVTTAQTAAVDELRKANDKLNFKEIYSAGMSVGREHIASLINTLILVYVGAGLSLFLLLVSATNQPLWVLFNSEYMAEEIVRALSGSAALILAVPISTFLAAWWYTKKHS